MLAPELAILGPACSPCNEAYQPDRGECQNGRDNPKLDPLIVEHGPEKWKSPDLTSRSGLPNKTKLRLFRHAAEQIQNDAQGDQADEAISAKGVNEVHQVLGHTAVA
jgi:hypothetical protein